MKTYIVYRDLQTNKIINYSVYDKAPDKLYDMIVEFNKKWIQTRKAEIADSEDLIAIIELAEKNKRVKESDLRSIEDKINDLQNEFYLLKESMA